MRWLARHYDNLALAVALVWRSVPAINQTALLVGSKIYVPAPVSANGLTLDEGFGEPTTNAPVT